MEMLPQGPQWKFKTFSTKRHPTKKKAELFFRDSLECIKTLFSHPSFAHHMDYTPFRLFETADKAMRIYREWLSGNAAWDFQVRQIHSLHF